MVTIRLKLNEIKSRRINLFIIYYRISQQIYVFIFSKILIKGQIYYSILLVISFILFIRKMDRWLRFYINYRGLITIIVKNFYLLSLITKILDRQYGLKVFTKLYLQDNHYQIQIKLDNRYKTINYTYYNYIKYLVISFRLANTLVIYQVSINQSLVGLVDTIYIVYLDNILLYSTNPTKYQNYIY